MVVTAAPTYRAVMANGLTMNLRSNIRVIQSCGLTNLIPSVAQRRPSININSMN